MFQLFVAPTAVEGWGEHDYDGTAERQLLAMLIVGLGALASDRSPSYAFC